MAATALTLIALVLGSGCNSTVFEPSDQTRYSSFRSVAGRRIGGDVIERYLNRRMAAVYDGVSFETVKHKTSEGHYEMTWRVNGPNADKGVGFGSAVPIDGRGYFLTASHCITHPTPNTVVYCNPNTPSLFDFAPARLVWQGDLSKGGPDLAILCIDRPIARIFNWALVRALMAKKAPKGGHRLAMFAEVRLRAMGPPAAKGDVSDS